MALFLRTVIVVLVVLALSGGSALAATATPTPTTAATTPSPVPCTITAAGVQIVLENPSPGDTLSSGTPIVITGAAYDTRATTGSGVSSVTIYLGSRDAGGLALGTAILGQPNPGSTQFANAGFTLRTPPLPTGNGSRSIFVYAKSLIDNSEGVLEVPIFLNTQPTPVRGQVPTAVLPTPPACTPTPVPTATQAPTNTPPPAVVNTSTPVPVATPTPLSVSAPLPPAPAPAAPAAPAVSAPATNPAPVAVAPTAAQTTAPRGGGIPAELGVIVFALGAAVVGGGLAVRRRRR